MGTVATLDPTFSAPFDDPDEAAPYSETAKARELEVRDAATDALLARVVRSFELADTFKPAVIDPLDKVTGRTVTSGGTGTLSLSEVTSAGFHVDGRSVALACTTLQASTTWLANHLGFSAGTPVAYTDLSSAALTAFTLGIRASTLTNLSLVQVAFYFSGSTANFAYFTVTPSVANAWETKTLTKATPTTTGGTVNWAQVSQVSIRLVVGAGGTYSGNIYVDDLRVSTGLLTLNTSRRWRVRWLDNNVAGTWAPWPTAYHTVKTSANPTVGAGAAPDATTPRPTVAWTFAGSGGKAQSSAIVDIFAGSGTAGELLHTGLVTGTATTYRVPAGVLPNGAQWTPRVTAYDTDGLSSSVTMAAVGPTAFSVPPMPTGPTVAGGINTTLAAAAAAGATNIRPASVAAVAVGDLVLIGSGSTAVAAIVTGPADAVTGAFNGTAGAAGTGIDLDRPLANAQALGAAVVEKARVDAIPDLTSSTVTVSWDTTPVPATHFYAYRLDRIERTGTAREVAVITDRAVTSYVDEEAHSGAEVSYRLTVDTGAFESDPAAPTTLLDTRDWHWTVPGHPEWSGYIRNVLAMDRAHPQSVEQYEALGRDATLEERGEVLAPTISVSGVLLPGQSVDIVAGLLAAARPDSAVAYGALKDNEGNVYRGLPRNVSDPQSRAVPGARDLSFDLTVTTT